VVGNLLGFLLILFFLRPLWNSHDNGVGDEIATAARRRLVIYRPNPKLAIKRKSSLALLAYVSFNEGNCDGRHR
jgi:hypothetical protein